MIGSDDLDNEDVEEARPRVEEAEASVTVSMYDGAQVVQRGANGAQIAGTSQNKTEPQIVLGFWCRTAANTIGSTVLRMDAIQVAITSSMTTIGKR